jgi:hypothetical protein
MLSDTRADPFLAGAVTAWRAERPGDAGLRHHQSRNGHKVWTGGALPVAEPRKRRRIRNARKTIEAGEL